jgi:hypothetical protein
MGGTFSALILDRVWSRFYKLGTVELFTSFSAGVLYAATASGMIKGAIL